jgi:hypothetical protein
MDDVAAWLDQLPLELGAQRRLLGRLLAWCRQDDDVRWLTIGCSFERGNADRLSDVDVAMGVKEEHFEEALGRVRHVMGTVGDLVESFDYLIPHSSPLRRFFAQYSDRTQIDLTLGFDPLVHIPRSVVLYDPEHAVHVVGDEVLAPKPDEVRLWACQGWEALVNVGKYLRRSSFWEALGQLDEARANLFRLWALAEKVPQACYGVTAIIDGGATMPPGIDESLPGAGLTGLLGAARYLAEELTELQRRLGRNESYQLPDAFADFVVADLANVPADTLSAAEQP